MLAQLVEQRTFNPFVVGSTPAHPTKQALKEHKKPATETIAGFFVSGVCVPEWRLCWIGCCTMSIWCQSPVRVTGSNLSVWRFVLQHFERTLC